MPPGKEIAKKTGNWQVAGLYNLTLLEALILVILRWE